MTKSLEQEKTQLGKDVSTARAREERAAAALDGHLSRRPDVTEPLAKVKEWQALLIQKRIESSTSKRELHRLEEELRQLG
jgi:hypothetical protein